MCKTSFEAGVRHTEKHYQDQFDLRMVPGKGPQVVHIETWELMNYAVDAASNEIVNICIGIADQHENGTDNIYRLLLKRFNINHDEFQRRSVSKL